MLKLGNTDINKSYLGELEINKLYLGSSLVFDNTIVSLTPIMTNFRAGDTNKDRVYFNAPLGSVVGIDASDFTIDGKTISSVNTTDNYFTLSADLNFWDNILIRKEAGNSNGCHDFTLQKISNNISEPVNSTIKYVAVGASGSGNSTGDPMVWSDAQSVSAGTTVYWKAGNYGSINFTASNSGTISQPIKHIGYKTTPGDAATLNRRNIIDGVDSFDSAEMPLLQNGSGTAMRPMDYMIIRNFQIDDYGAGYCINIDDRDYTITDNIYIRDTQFGIWSNSSVQRNNKILNSLALGVYKNPIKVADRHNLIDDVWVVSTQVLGQDYYITIKGGTTGYSNAVTNCRVERVSGDSHSGHGISFKSDQYVDGYKVINSLIEDCVLINDQIEMRHVPTYDNVIRNVNISGTTSAIISRDGAHSNTFENITATNVSTWHLWYETPEYTTSDPNSSNNKFINCVVDGADLLFGTGSYSSTQASVIEGNDFLNCTFIDVTDIYNDASIEIDNTNNITNCIFDTCPDLGSGDLNAVFTNNLFYNGFTATGTGQITVNPQLDSSYEPQATFTDIDVTPVSGVYYDKNGKERNVSPEKTTVGAVAIEVLVPDTTAPTLSTITIENASPTNVVMVFDEAVTGTNLGFTLSGTTSSTFSSISGSGDTWTGVLGTAAASGETITLSYSESTGDFKDTSDNALEDITNQSVTNNVSSITNYVFDGTSTAKMVEEGGTMLDGIVNQTILVRVKMTSSNYQHGILGTENDGSAIKLEVDSDDNKADGKFQDTGSSAFTNATLSNDGTWHNLFMFYDGTYVGLYEDNTLVRETTDGDFTARTSGREFVIGSTLIGITDDMLKGEVSDIQIYNKRLTVGEISDLNTDITDTTTGLVANFAGDKSPTVWTDDVSGYELTSQGGVTTT